MSAALHPLNTFFYEYRRGLVSDMDPQGRGTLIVIEGLDRAGKSTQCELLGNYLRTRLGDGLVKLLKFPDRTTPIGQMIHSYLSGSTSQEDHVIHLLFSANRWEIAASIEADLKSGITCIIDRYVYSGCVYSASKMNESLDLRWARQPEEGLPKPDLCIFLDIPSEIAAKRGGYGAERYEEQKMQNTVREMFQKIISSSDGDIFSIYDASLPVHEVHLLIAEKAHQVVKQVREQSAQLQHFLPLRI